MEMSSTDDESFLSPPEASQEEILLTTSSRANLFGQQQTTRRRDSFSHSSPCSPLSRTFTYSNNFPHTSPSKERVRSHLENRPKPSLEARMQSGLPFFSSSRVKKAQSEPNIFNKIPRPPAQQDLPTINLPSPVLSDLSETSSYSSSSSSSFFSINKNKFCSLETLPDSNRITPETLNDLMTGKTKKLNYQIIDCRFPYEFDGGHIQDAINIYSTEYLKEYYHHLCLRNEEDRPVLIFHCEFSSHRGPKMEDHLRKLDRKNNVYPALSIPEIYILEGGYKAFFKSYKNLCSGQYIEMKNEKFLELGRRMLCFFNSQFKSRSTGQMIFEKKYSNFECFEKRNFEIALFDES